MTEKFNRLNDIVRLITLLGDDFKEVMMIYRIIN